MSVDVNPNQKGSSLTGGLISDEALASSSSILSQKRGGGAQQYYTPEPAAKLITNVIGHAMTTLDPTAGDGSLLRFFGLERRFGIELDPDQVKNAKEAGREYAAVKGDFQRVYPLLAQTGITFDALVMNPPFGMRWSIPSLTDGKEVNSALLTLQAGMNLLHSRGQFAFIAGKGRFYKHIAGKSFARGIYAVVDVPDLFPGTTLEAVIAFGVAPAMRDEFCEGEPQFESREMVCENLDLLSSWVEEKKAEATVAEAYKSYGTTYAHRFRSQVDYYSLKSQWGAIQAEHNRRRDAREAEEKNDKFDVELYGGDRLNVKPSAYTRIVLAKLGKDYHVTRLDGASINYFIQNERDWRFLSDIAQDGLLTIDPRVAEKVDAALADTRRVLCPLYPLKDVQRLGFLSDVDSLLCKKSDGEKGFEAGVRYDLDTQTKTITDHERRSVQITTGKRAGEWEDRDYEIVRKVLQIKVGHWVFTDSEKDAASIQFLIDHFEIPDPGDVGSRYPEETERMRQLLREIEQDTILPHSTAWNETNPEHPPVTFRKFQVEDLARLLVKGDGMISWEQGLGKTLGGLTFAEASIRLGAQEAVLVIAPKDLIPQWQRECQRFLGRKMTLLKKHGDAKRIAKELKAGGTGWYITYPEALSITGTRKSKALDPVIVEERTEEKLVKGTDCWGTWTLDDEGRKRKVSSSDYWKSRKAEGAVYNETHGQGWIPPRWEMVTKQITSKEVCPECRSDRNNGWNGFQCEAAKPDGSQCGYSHYAIRVKPMGSLLSCAFRHGVVINDESTMIQGDYSKRSLVIRGIKAKRKLGMTGTPIKNYVPQAFWPLWWCLGNNSERFGYGYNDKSKFEENFAVIEMYRTARDNARKGRKALPEVTNLSRFWRMTASSIIRRRKEDTGEPIVPRYFFEIATPLGIAQRLQINKWAKHFPAFFKEKYPDAPVVQAGMHEVMAPMLGLSQKLEYAEVVPLGDPEWDWLPDEEADSLGEFQETDGVSNFTPATVKVMELSMALAKEGRKVLVGSPLLATARFIADQLAEKGVNAVHVLDESGQTQNPEARAETVYDFQTNDVQVLCTGIQAIRFGHNLDKGSAVVLLGLPWDFESMDQFIARVHRLTSEREVHVYVVVPGEGTVSSKKWELLKLKGQASSLALDGRIIKEKSVDIDRASIIRELQEKGVPVSGDEIEEEEVEKVWMEMPVFEDYEVPEGLLRDPEDALDLDLDTEKDAEAPLPEAEETPAVLEVLADEGIAVELEAEQVFEDDTDEAFHQLDTGRAEAELEAETVEEQEIEVESEEDEEELDGCTTCGEPFDEDRPMSQADPNACVVCHPDPVVEEPAVEPEPEPVSVSEPELEVVAEAPAAAPVELPEGLDPSIAAVLAQMQQQIGQLAAENAELKKTVTKRSNGKASEAEEPAQLQLV